MNNCQFMGRLTKDPELKTTTSGIMVASFTLAVPRKFKRDGEPEADFFRVTAWRQTAEFVQKYFFKGMRVAVTGRVEIREYNDREGVKKQITEVQADSVYFADAPRQDTPRQAETTAFVDIDDIELPF